jgi:hypothetical protein
MKILKLFRETFSPEKEAQFTACGSLFFMFLLYVSSTLILNTGLTTLCGCNAIILSKNSARVF